MDTQPMPLGASETTPETLRFAFVDRPGLLKLTLVNLLLGIVTLGFHRFWAKTNLRRYIWSCVHINDEPLEYTGTGMELFKGFLMVLFAMLIPYGILQMVVQFNTEGFSVWPIIIQYGFLLIVSILWGYGFYTARRYNLSRTHWRGIRGALVGSPMSFTWTYFGSILADTFSMGWSRPAMNTIIQEHLINDMRFGDAAFKFKGRAGPLYGAFAACWFMSLLLMAALVGIAIAVFSWTGAGDVFGQVMQGLDPKEIKSFGKFFATVFALIFAVLIIYQIFHAVIWSIYMVKELNTFSSYTRFDGAQFKTDITTWQALKLALGNILIAIFTLTIGMPFVYRRTARFYINRLSLIGAVDIDRIGQSNAKIDSSGQGLLDAFDIGGLW